MIKDYMLKCFFLFSLLSFSIAHAFTLKIVNESNLSAPLDKIQQDFIRANELFENSFGSMGGEILLVLDSKSCFRTGYNFKENKINFCQNLNVINMGLNSIDVFNHELFHAFICNYQNNLCKDDLQVSVHEGIADFFSYLLNPDECFGENFYINKECVRMYNTSFELGFIEDDHAIGNVLAKILIRNKTPLKKSTLLFHDFKVIDKVFENLNGRSKSKINKYRLAKNEIFKIEFTFEYNSDVKAIWAQNDQIIIKESNRNSFEISIIENAKSQVSTVYFLNNKEEVIGYRKYYFGKSIDNNN